MKLLRLTVEKVRGIPDGAHRFAAAASGLPLGQVLLTGAPASGKTSLLEVITAVKEATGSYGAPLMPTRFLRPGAAQARVEATWLLTEAEAQRARLQGTQHTSVWEIGESGARIQAEAHLRQLFAGYSRDPGQGKFEYFPANRRLLGAATRPPSASSPSDAAEGRLRLTRDPDKYAGLRRLFHDLTLADAARLSQLLDTQGIALRTQQPDALAPFKEAIAALLPDLRLASVELGERATRVWFQRRDGARVELDELSDSEQQALLFAVTFRRLGLNHSVILIDTPELHLHPRRVAPFFGRLVELGRDNQIIAATTSAELLATVRPEQVIDLGQG